MFPEKHQQRIICFILPDLWLSHRHWWRFQSCGLWGFAYW